MPMTEWLSTKVSIVDLIRASETSTYELNDSYYAKVSPRASELQLPTHRWGFADICGEFL